MFVLEEYFATTERDDPTYEDAVALYREAVPENQQSAAQLVNDCDEPKSPAIPDGAAASMEQMVEGQSRMKEFVAAGETYIACLTKIIDDQKRSTEERNTAIGAHNRMVSAMEQAAATFNAELREFKARPGLPRPDARSAIPARRRATLRAQSVAHCRRRCSPRPSPLNRAALLAMR